MAGTNAAYDLSRFEAQPLEKRPHIETVKTKKVKTVEQTVPRISPLKAVGCMLLVVLVASALLYTRVQLTERISQVSQATSDYTKLEAEGTRLDLELESKVSPKNVQEYAENELGMIQKDSTTVEYIRLTQDNKIEVPKSTSSSFWDSVKEFFDNLLS